MINTKITIDGSTYKTQVEMDVERTMSGDNATSKFWATFRNDNGQYDDEFSLNDEVIIYADKNTDPAVTKIFTGIIENIKFTGYFDEERIEITGRDYGAILQDIIVEPRIFKNIETSQIVEALLTQNAVGRGLTWTNINATTTVIERITFNNLSIFDAISQLAEIAGYYFYIDTDKDFHFELKANISSGLTFGKVPVSIEEDPVLHYKMNDDDTNATITDSSENSIDGTAFQNSDQLSVAGKINEAITFDGVSDLIDIPDSDLINTRISSLRSFSFWIKADDLTTRQVIFKEGGVTNGFNIYIESDNIIFIYWGSGSQLGYVECPIADNDWHHVACTFNSTGSNQKIFFDSLKIDTDTNSTAIPSHSSDNTLGYSNATIDYKDGFSTTANYFDGTLDDFRIYNSDLSTSKVSAIYNSGDGTEDQNPVYDYDYNITNSNFKNSDKDIFNYITVYGDRQLTGVRENFASPTTGSTYILDDKPSNTVVMGSGTIITYISPGGVLNVVDPATDDAKWTVDYPSKAVTFLSGTRAGDNTGWIGSVVYVDYQRSSPIVSIRQDTASQTSYGKKSKIVVDRNIKELSEASIKATTLLSELKDPVIEGKMNIHGVIDVTPGNTVVVDIPFYDISTQTYTVLNAVYNFTKKNCLSDQVLSISVNKKIKNFLDYTKEVELRLRNLEGSEVDTSITNIATGTGSIVGGGSFVCIQRSIGSSFYFHTSGHDILDHTAATLGDMRLGSTIAVGTY